MIRAPGLTASAVNSGIRNLKSAIDGSEEKRDF
jgi:hypothetical protein